LVSKGIKVKIKKNTWLLLLSALVLTGGVYLLQRLPQIETNRDKANHFLSFNNDDLEKMSIQTGDHQLVFIRQSENWQMDEPEKTPANPAALSFFTDLLFGDRNYRSFSLVKERLSEYGLDKPVATVGLMLKNKQSHQLKFGNTSADGKSIYGQIDNLPTVYVLPIEFKYAVDRNLPEWKQSAASRKGEHYQCG